MLAAFYAVVAVVFLGVSLVSHRLAETLFPWVALMLLIPALYAETLRIRRGD